MPEVPRENWCAGDALADARCTQLLDPGTIGPGATAAVPDLIRALNNADDNLRAAAATALGKIGGGAKDAIRSLTKLQKDEAFAVRQAAARALRVIDPGA
jgi:HEAT repeat protein